MRDLTPIRLSDFGGLFDRGNIDNVPTNCFAYAQNVMCGGAGGVQVRDGSRLLKATGLGSPILDVLPYNRSDGTRLLVLTEAGNVYDDFLGYASPIISYTAGTRISVCSLFNRAYISPHNLSTGLSGGVVSVYDGTTARNAAGVAVPATPVAAANGAAGKVDAGLHLIGVAYETASGYLTPFGAVLATYTAPGGVKINVSSIPVGPTGTAARILVVTRGIQAYTGNTGDYAFYRVPSGRIANNTATTLTIDFYDTELIESLDYLLDLKTTIPAGVCLAPYSGRLAVAGVFGHEAIGYLSDFNDPETIRATDGFNIVDPGDGGGIRNITVNGGVLYYFKSGRIFSTSDTGGPPASWPIASIDGAVGAECFGIANTLNSQRDTLAHTIIVSHAGIFHFTGAALPEIPLTQKIDSLWNNEIFQSVSRFRKFKVVNDPAGQRIYVLVSFSAGLYAAGPMWQILVGDYNQGLTPLFTATGANIGGIKWSIWQIAGQVNGPPVLGSYAVPGTEIPIVYFTIGADIYYFDRTAETDFGNPIVANFVLGYAEPQGSDGQVHTWNAIRIKGSGTNNRRTKIIVRGEDWSSDGSPLLQSRNLTLHPTVPAQGAAHRWQQALFNLHAERCAVGMELPAKGDIQKITIFYKKLWESRIYQEAVETLVPSDEGVGVAPTGVPAEMTSPVNESEFATSPITFTWTAGTNVTKYWLFIGNAIGGSDIYSADEGVLLTDTVAVPVDGRRIYVRLRSFIGSEWFYNDYSYNQGSGAADVPIKNFIARATAVVAGAGPFVWDTEDTNEDGAVFARTGGNVTISLTGTGIYAVSVLATSQLNGSQLYDDFYITDSGGNIIAATRQSPEEPDVSARFVSGTLTVLLAVTGTGSVTVTNYQGNRYGNPTNAFSKICVSKLT